MFRLRPYQQHGVDAIRAEFGAGRRSVLFVAPTGSGKTVLFCYIAAGIYRKRKRVVVIVHRDELIRQVSDALGEYEIEHGTLTGGKPGIPTAPVVVASVFTLARRLSHFPAPDLIVVDECHHATNFTTWGRVIRAFPDAKVLGVTATPVRLDGHGLGRCFESMVLGPTIRDLTRDGWLAPAEVYAPPNEVDLSKVKRRGGDYAIDEIAAIMDQSTITGDAVDHYRRLAPGKAGVAFCASIRHAMHVAEQFRAAGYAAAHVDGKQDTADIRAALDGLRGGTINVVASCDLISEGMDVPRIEVAMLLRPTQSTGLFLQQVGRALRPFPGKDKAIILDHAGNTHRHGLPDDDRQWSLDDAPVKRPRQDSDGPRLRNCPHCYAIHATAPVCPRCGFVYAPMGRIPEHVSGQLQKIDPMQLELPLRIAVKHARTPDELEQIARKRGITPNWSYYNWAARLRSAP